MRHHFSIWYSFSLCSLFISKVYVVCSDRNPLFPTHNEFIKFRSYFQFTGLTQHGSTKQLRLSEFLTETTISQYKLNTMSPSIYGFSVYGDRYSVTGYTIFQLSFHYSSETWTVFYISTRSSHVRRTSQIVTLRALVS